ncbi:peptidoglycan DD-metalloendopeptidase family protein [Teredinibacter haidensis]|uniref:peptidoglycan DD-metalloendopeptidase family protein n=1 Tax=Teredinibacter haidensis TaxID=2731755 RepID=UPI00094904BD|nr:peptidoglycan DD-metalloendopeptidase family protein [Teredinibacter haidensis]
MEMLTASVGRGGRNQFKDVATIQTLINDCLYLLGPLCFLQVDGKIGARTIDAIDMFQKIAMKMTKPDGRVDPRGKTLMALNFKKIRPRPHLVTGLFRDISKPFFKTPSEPSYKFPLAMRPRESYKTGMRRFGATRSGGRLHAGCDLYAQIGTPVYAMADGVVETAGYEFYLGTYAVEVKHLDFLALYGELGKVSSPLKKGATVKKGQLVGKIGKLQGLNMSMLHLEMYSGKENGRLTVKSNLPYKRRSDLIDPTSILDKAK